jgi:DNA-binding PadR family transcriptional regulator
MPAASPKPHGPHGQHTREKNEMPHDHDEQHNHEKQEKHEKHERHEKHGKHGHHEKHDGHPPHVGHGRHHGPHAGHGPDHGPAGHGPDHGHDAADLDLDRAPGRGPGSHGPDRHGPGARSGRRGGGGRGHGRLFAQGELQLVLLSFIEKAPGHGYELIKAIEEKFAGNYSPSPGAIYPTLTLLEDQGFVESAVRAGNGSRRLFSITDEGRQHLQARQAQVDGALARLEMSVRALAGKMPPEAVIESMSTLKHALQFHAAGWSDAEVTRVADLIRQTAEAISAPGETPSPAADAEAA